MAETAQAPADLRKRILESDLPEERKQRAIQRAIERGLLQPQRQTGPLTAEQRRIQAQQQRTQTRVQRREALGGGPAGGLVNAITEFISTQPPGGPRERLIAPVRLPAPIEAAFNAALITTGVASGLGLAGSRLAGTQLAQAVIQRHPKLARFMPVLTEMAGDFLARQVNVQVGLEEEGFSEDFLALFGAPAGRVVLRGMRSAAASVIPKMKIGRFSRQEQIRNANRLIRRDIAQATQRLRNAASAQVDQYVQSVSGIFGLDPNEFTGITRSAQFRKSRDAVQALADFPATAGRLTATLQKRLNALGVQQTAMTKRALQAADRQLRRQITAARGTHQALTDYITDARIKAANALQQQARLAPGQLDTFTRNLNPPTPEAVDEAYKAVKEFGTVSIPRQRFTAIQQFFRAQEDAIIAAAPGFEDRELLRMLQIPLEEGTDVPLSAIPFEVFQNLMKRLGKRIASLKDQVAARTSTTARETLGSTQQLYAALQKTLDDVADDAGAGPAANALRHANFLNKQMRTAEELSDVFKHAIGQPDAQGFVTFDARKARRLLDELDENRVLRERIQQLPGDVWGGLTTMLETIAKSSEDAAQVRGQLDALRTVTRSPTPRPRLEPPSPARPQVGEVVVPPDVARTREAAQRLQQEGQRIADLPRRADPSDFPPLQPLPDELVKRPGSGGELYRAAIAAGAFAGAGVFAAMRRFAEAAVISAIMLPGMLGYAATTPRGQKILMRMMEYNGGVLDPNVVEGILGATIRAGLSGYVSMGALQVQARSEGFFPGLEAPPEDLPVPLQ